MTEQTMKIAPSILSSDFSILGAEIQEVEKFGADYIHYDVMDGNFVKNITIGIPVLESIRKVTKLPIDVHLMIASPENYVADFAKAGADILTVHAESTQHLHGVLQQIRSLGVKAGVVINPATSVEVIRPILHMVDLVLIMTVNPGFGGQAFLPECLEKVKEVADIRREKNYTYEIEVDGGVDDKTIRDCKEAGANVFVAGSYIFSAEDRQEKINLLRKQIEG